MSNIIETVYSFHLKIEKLVIDECDGRSLLGLSFAFAEQANLGVRIISNLLLRSVFSFYALIYMR